MTPLVEHIKTARTPQEALLILAEAIDNIRTVVASLPTAAPTDPWQQIIDWSDPAVVGETQRSMNRPTPTDDGRSRFVDGEVIVGPVSTERQEARAYFATTSRLHEFYGNGLDLEAFVQAYRKGGPRWLYYTNRDCVMQMPMSLRQQLVEDVLLDSPSEADEIGRDILKHIEGVDQGTQIDWQRNARELGPLT